jgi:hypothetical protein
MPSTILVLTSATTLRLGSWYILFSFWCKSFVACHSTYMNGKSCRTICAISAQLISSCIDNVAYLWICGCFLSIASVAFCPSSIYFAQRLVWCRCVCVRMFVVLPETDHTNSKFDLYLFFCSLMAWDSWRRCNGSVRRSPRQTKNTFRAIFHGHLTF